MTTHKRIEAIEESAKANSDYALKFQFAVHDKIALIGQTSALHMCLQERLADIALLLSLVKEYRAALEFYASCAIKSWEPPCNHLGDRAREALARGEGMG